MLTEGGARRRGDASRARQRSVDGGRDPSGDFDGRPGTKQKS